MQCMNSSLSVSRREVLYDGIQLQVKEWWEKPYDMHVHTQTHTVS